MFDFLRFDDGFRVRRVDFGDLQAGVNTAWSSRSGGRKRKKKLGSLSGMVTGVTTGALGGTACRSSSLRCVGELVQLHEEGDHGTSDFLKRRRTRTEILVMAPASTSEEHVSELQSFTRFGVDCEALLGCPFLSDFGCIFCQKLCYDPDWPRIYVATS